MGIVLKEMDGLVSKVQREVDTERSGVTARMKSLAIRQTERRLNDMRRGHVQELERVLGDTVMTVAGTLVTQDSKQVKQLREALNAKRDEMIELAREEKYRGLEVAVGLLEKQHQSKVDRMRADAEVTARAELQRRLTVSERNYRVGMAESEVRHSESRRTCQ